MRLTGKYVPCPVCGEDYWVIPSKPVATCSRKCAAVLRRKPRTKPKEKECKKCGVVKPSSSFYNDKNRADGKYPYCKECQATVQEGRLKERQDYYRRWKYDVAPEEYESKLKEQDGRCAICLVNFTKRPPHLDHDHETGSFRGILCSGCNTGLGLFKDDPVSLRRAIAYIERGMS